MLIPQILPADVGKVIYLDSDIIVNLDICELWKVEFDDKLLAAVTEVSNDVVPKSVPLCADGFVAGEDYFNSGVLLINLLTFGEEWNSIVKGILFVENNHQFRYMDQDILNYCFSTRTVKLPRKFNRSVAHERKINDAVLAGKIHHFYGGSLRFELNDPFNRLWMHYFVRTPFFDADSLGRLYADVQQQLHVGFNQKMINITIMMSGKTRGFFVAPPDVNVIRKIFAVRPDEEVIAAENPESFQKLLDAMNASRGKKIFFIVLPNFPFQILIQAGFVAGRDFVNCFDFLSKAQGVPFNSHSLIQSM